MRTETSTRWGVARSSGWMPSPMVTSSPSSRIVYSAIRTLAAFEHHVAVALQEALAAVDEDVLAGDAAAGEQMLHRGGDIVERDRSLEEVLARMLGELLVALVEAGEGEAGGHRVDADLRRQRARQHLGGGGEGGLAAGIGEEVGVQIGELLVEQVDHRAVL